MRQRNPNYSDAEYERSVLYYEKAHYEGDRERRLPMLDDAPQEVRDHFVPSTGMPLPDDIITDPNSYRRHQGWEGELVIMSPREYVERVAEGFGSSYEAQVDQSYEKIVQDYTKQLKMGRKFPILTLEYQGEGFGQEGRHRALACERAGITQVPVFIVRDAKPRNNPRCDHQWESRFPNLKHTHSDLQRCSRCGTTRTRNKYWSPSNPVKKWKYDYRTRREPRSNPLFGKKERNPEEVYIMFQKLQPDADLFGELPDPVGQLERVGYMRSMVYHCSKWDEDRNMPDNTDIRYIHDWENNQPLLATDGKGHYYIVGKVLITQHGIEDYEGKNTWKGKQKMDLTVPDEVAFLGVLENITVKGDKKIEFDHHLLGATKDELFIIEVDDTTYDWVAENYRLSL